MSLNIAPIYGRQYIRYVETWEAATDNQAGDVGVVELGEFRVVTYATYAGANKVCAPGDVTTFNGTIVGVNQSFIPTSASQPYTARQASVATSGSLLVEVDPTAKFEAPDLNTQLRVNNLGQAADGGTAVTLDGTTPLIREIVEIGGRQLVLVSFN